MNGIAIPEAGLANIIQNNDIMSNILNGILISGSSTLNEVLENSITDSMLNGILISGSSTRNDVRVNAIANNALNGILISGSSTANTISGNSISLHSGLGIDLGGDGVTPNDPGDTDTGANNLQNAPEILGIVVNEFNAIISGSLNSTPDTKFTIEFFSNSGCNVSGFGEGETFMGSIDTETDAAGDATFAFSATIPQVQNTFITATATDSKGNTSEFSACFTME
ncbi:MAG: hypothetical protein ETSY1_31590 [Candidatus Entotheonella factor]|uniref:Right handed beta helix domain-containing protein n=1 Tax=Entotheonella factor TaxID=1429438 RepID=W4LAT4_ENTF1|nr:MAG: hypothetical protein ETSY1_31590 [Candidatus Entotheonella factor]